MVPDPQPSARARVRARRTRRRRGPRRSRAHRPGAHRPGRASGSVRRAGTRSRSRARADRCDERPPAPRARQVGFSVQSRRSRGRPTTVGSGSASWMKRSRVRAPRATSGAPPRARTACRCPAGQTGCRGSPSQVGAATQKPLDAPHAERSHRASAPQSSPSTTQTAHDDGSGATVIPARAASHSLSYRRPSQSQAGTPSAGGHSVGRRTHSPRPAHFRDAAEELGPTLPARGAAGLSQGSPSSQTSRPQL